MKVHFFFCINLGQLSKGFRCVVGDDNDLLHQAWFF